MIDIASDDKMFDYIPTVLLHAHPLNVQLTVRAKHDLEIIQMGSAIDCLINIQDLLNDDNRFKKAMFACNKVGWNATNLLFKRAMVLMKSINCGHVNKSHAKLSNEPLDWIIQNGFHMNRIPIGFRYDQSLIRRQRLKDLTKLGYNPKVQRYMETAEVAAKNNQRISQKLGHYYSKFDDDVWFTLTSSTCEDTCLQDSDKFIPIDKIRVPIDESNKIGSGGFGNVYKGYLHNTIVAVKIINVTESYQQLGRVGQDVAVYEALTGNVALEAIVQGQLKHRHILPAIEHWIQCQNLSTISLVIATPLCIMNLQEWLDSKPYDFTQVTHFMGQMVQVGVQ